jgi:hypothetical protein
MARFAPAAQKQLVSPNGILNKNSDHIATNCLAQKRQVHWQIKNHPQTFVGVKGKYIGIYPCPNHVSKLASVF